MPVALTIAGSDSGGGAGIEADLKTFAALGVHGVVAITSVTAQNTYTVTAIHDLPPEMVVKQVEAVAEDIGVDAAKTGMLSNEGIIRAVARVVKKYGFPLVVDPVMIAKSGAPLLRPEAMDALIEEIIPLATLVTPNRFEAEKITGLRIKGLEDARKAAKKIVEDYGAKAAIVKGGHVLEDSDESIDVMYYDGEFYVYRAPRIRDGCTHGTGCSFSAAIAAELAKGKELVEAVAVAKKFITMAIDYGIRIGKGHCPVNPMAWLEIPAEKYWALQDVKEAVEKLLSNASLVAPYAPEVGINIARSIKPFYARSVEDVAGVEGRIVRTRRGLVQVGPVEMGASSHMARAVLAAQEYGDARAAVNIGFSEELVEAAKRLGFSAVEVKREEEPVEVRSAEGRSMQWIIARAVEENNGRIPDIVYDRGWWGREAMIRVFGGTAVEAVEKLLKIISNTRRGDEG